MCADCLSFLGDADNVIIIVNSLYRNKIHIIRELVDQLPHGASAMCPEEVELDLFSLSGVGDQDDVLVRLNLYKANNLVSVCQVHASYTVCCSSHYPDIVNGEPQSLAVLGHNHCLIALLDEQTLDQRIALIKDNSLDSVLPGVDEVNDAESVNVIPAGVFMVKGFSF